MFSVLTEEFYLPKIAKTVALQMWHRLVQQERPV